MEVLGQVVILKKETITKGENYTIIDISKLSSGPYYFKLDAMDGQIRECKQILVK